MRGSGERTGSDQASEAPSSQTSVWAFFFFFFPEKESHSVS